MVLLAVVAGLSAVVVQHFVVLAVLVAHKIVRIPLALFVEVACRRVGGANIAVRAHEVAVAFRRAQGCPFACAIQPAVIAGDAPAAVLCADGSCLVPPAPRVSVTRHRRGPSVEASALAEAIAALNGAHAVRKANGVELRQRCSGVLLRREACA